MDSKSLQIIFDTPLFLMRRQRALEKSKAATKNPWFLHEFAISGLIETLNTIKPDFENALELFSNLSQFREAALEDGIWGENGKIKNLLEYEPAFDFKSSNKINCITEIENLPLEANKFDLIISNSGLNWVNDLPGILYKIRTSLRPNGNFIATFLGGQTLTELRQCFLDAESEIFGGASPRINPMIDAESGVRLLSRAGFSSPVSSIESLNVRYDNVFGLFRDIKAMGEAACFAYKGSKPLNRHLIAKVADLYQERHMDEDGRVRATFELITLSGWTENK